MRHKRVSAHQRARFFAVGLAALGTIGVLGSTVGVASAASVAPAHQARTSCTINVALTAHHATLKGAGLGPSEAVTVDYRTTRSRHDVMLGAWRTNRHGSFRARVVLPGERDDHSGRVVAHSAHSECSAAARPHSSAATTTAYPPTTPYPPTTAYPPTTSTAYPPTTSSASPPTTSPTTTTSPTSSATGSGSSATTSGAGASTGASSSTSTSPAPSPGRSGATTSTTSPTPVKPTPTNTPAALGSQSSGVPTSFIVTVAVVLLLLGGLAVLVLTRRA